ncbi:hypothetical protein SAMN05216490_3146 [Mucilaginibacter mallensis]|uniref:Uncharacterized protein n=1 Tax=Mucilaginibacter mallensis TaxID=652787 RepID=A0A1H1ZK76_MUCMA|nr:hypothetical protein SAMN05216490_3146 [Mucilaginibacter mallensis]
MAFFEFCNPEGKHLNDGPLHYLYKSFAQVVLQENISRDIIFLQTLPSQRQDMHNHVAYQVPGNCLLPIHSRH